MGTSSKEYRDKNRDKINAYLRQWKKDNPDKRYINSRRSQLKRRYGITLEDYQQLLEEQDNQCALCDKTQEQEKIAGKSLAVDHCHITGQIRGILCNDCNRNLIRHRPLEVFKRAVVYLEKYDGKRQKI